MTWALLLPTTLLAMVVGMQAALFYQARSLALAGAEECAHAAAAYDGSAAAGKGVGEQFMRRNRLGLRSAQVVALRGTVSATCRVSTAPQLLIPRLQLNVLQVATLPLERLTR